MRSVNLWIARSGRCRGPYTVKNRRQMIFTGYRWANACAISSPARLLAAYGEIGATAGSVSANGAGVALPYTDDEDPKTMRFSPMRRAASIRRAVAVTFASIYDPGSSSDGRTPGFAAR